MNVDFDTLRHRFRDLPEPGDEVRAGARRRLLDEISLNRVDTSASRQTDRFRRHSTLVVLAAVLAIAAPLAIAAGVYFREFPRPSDVPRSAEPVRIGPKLVSADGEVDGVNWRLVTYRARDEDQDGTFRIVLCQQIQFAGKVSASSGGCGVSPFQGGVSLPGIDYLGAGVERTWFVGRVSLAAASVTLVLADGRTVEAKTYGTPPSLGLPYAYYIAVVGGEIGNLDDAVREVVARDPDGAVIGRARGGAKP